MHASPILLRAVVHASPILPYNEQPWRYIVARRSDSDAFAKILEENAPLSVRALKEVLHRGLTVSKTDGLAMAQHILAPIKYSEDIKEGPRAFAEKRQPVWKGR